ncbi:hypothetical protein GR217_34415 [Rhizobium leguminosarum]|uniref:Uncharacterized protein n=1 Tax=Rhizobium ruizarguesonis TaxID=2081791 RepID=A0AAE4YWW5_9HYPH|nr:hypothetical protein [Rhizobium ruizarguesonis]NEI52715.1 hypothetical protein [Rhizobium ruizarguesonis]
MSIAFGSISQTAYAVRTNTTVPAPAGIADGDLLIAHMIVSGNGTAMTPPAGWTQIGSTATAIDAGSTFFLNSRVYVKTAAGESGDYTFLHSSGSSQGTIARYTGANGVINTFSSNVQNFSPGTTTRTATSITTTADGCMLLFVGLDWGDTTNDLTPPAGFTEREDVLLSYWADEVQATAGATGDVSHTCNSSVLDPRLAWLIALEPTLTASDQTINGALYVDADTFHGATVGRGTVNIAAARYVSPDTFYRATISLGGVAATDDPRENILARLVTLAKDITGIKTVKRNDLDLPETALPAIVILDGDETADDNDPVGRPPTAPRIVTMTPEFYVVVAEKAANVGTQINMYRALVIDAVATDAQLIGLTKNKEGGRYDGAASGLARGRTMTGEIGLSFSFRYVLRPGSI